MRTTFALLFLAAVILLVPATSADAIPNYCEDMPIQGPSNVYAETGCVNPVWRADCTCRNHATPAYSWTIDGSYAGSGWSATRQYCPVSPPEAYTMTVSVTISCGRQSFPKSKSVFVSLCDNSGWGLPLCLG